MYSVLFKTVNRKKALQVSYQHHTMVFSTKEQRGITEREWFLKGICMGALSGQI